MKLWAVKKKIKKLQPLHAWKKKILRTLQTMMKNDMWNTESIIMPQACPLNDTPT